MYQHAISSSTTPAASPVDINDALREKIDAALGEPIRVDTAIVIKDETPQPHIVVVVVERRRLPGDQELQRYFSLTPRESEVARLLVDRLSDEEISRRLDIRLNTARCHSNRVLGKLGLHSRNDVRSALLERNGGPGSFCERNVA